MSPRSVPLLLLLTGLALPAASHANTPARASRLMEQERPDRAWRLCERQLEQTSGSPGSFSSRLGPEWYPLCADIKLADLLQRHEGAPGWALLEQLLVEWPETPTAERVTPMAARARLDTAGEDLDLLHEIVERYPGTESADSAWDRIWEEEWRQARGDAEALLAFAGRRPQAPRAAEAREEAGTLLFEEADSRQTRTAWERILELFPDHERGRHIRRRIQQLAAHDDLIRQGQARLAEVLGLSSLDPRGLVLGGFSCAEAPAPDAPDLELLRCTRPGSGTIELLGPAGEDPWVISAHDLAGPLFHQLTGEMIERMEPHRGQLEEDHDHRFQWRGGDLGAAAAAEELSTRLWFFQRSAETRLAAIAPRAAARRDDDDAVEQADRYRALFHDPNQLRFEGIDGAAEHVLAYGEGRVLRQTRGADDEPLLEVVDLALRRAVLLAVGDEPGGLLSVARIDEHWAIASCPAPPPAPEPLAEGVGDIGTGAEDEAEAETGPPPCATQLPSCSIYLLPVRGEPVLAQLPGAADDPAFSDALCAEPPAPPVQEQCRFGGETLRCGDSEIAVTNPDGAPIELPPDRFQLWRLPGEEALLASSLVSFTGTFRDGALVLTGTELGQLELDAAPIPLPMGGWLVQVVDDWGGTEQVWVVDGERHRLSTPLAFGTSLPWADLLVFGQDNQLWDVAQRPPRALPFRLRSSETILRAGDWIYIQEPDGSFRALTLRN